ncbi:NF-kappa-B inhibitor zeta [Gadus morhua]|uniref:NF-kappa-B inhibitor zeta n=1 Tax=Gadus morhua TaxID=8049 RepID=A0A8C5AL90_GADMO|nr:NF-kappa-B inhibitor zeta-like [Gadus morhua]
MSQALSARRTHGGVMSQAVSARGTHGGAMSQTVSARGHTHTGSRLTVRELIELHRRTTGAQPAKRQRCHRDALTHPYMWGGNRPPPANPALKSGADPLSTAEAAPCKVSRCDLFDDGVSTICQPYVERSPPRGLDLPAAEPESVGRAVSLFQWQVMREIGRLGAVTESLLRIQDEDGDTCLHIAVAQGKRALAYALAKKSVGSIDTNENNGQSALHIAVITNQPLIVQDLLLLGAKVNIRDRWGRSPLHVCAENGHALTLEIIQTTLCLGNCQPINVELLNYEGLSPLHVAVTSYNTLVRELRRLGEGCPLVAMEIARRQGQLAACVRTLLLMGAQCGTQDRKNGKTVLHLASEEAQGELFLLLLHHPSSSSIINHKTYSGNTALHIVSSLARDAGALTPLDTLLRAGADPGARNLENEQPAHLVPHSPVRDKVRKLIKGHNYYALFLTAPKMHKRCQLDSPTFY